MKSINRGKLKVDIIPKKKIVTVNIVLLLASFFLLFPIAILVPYNRLAVDDFCVGSKMQKLGLFGSQLDAYRTWSGRYFSFYIRGIVSTFSASNIINIYTLLLFLVVIFSIFVFFVYAEKIDKITALVSSLFLTGVLFYLTPNKPESWFWLSGSSTYLLPLALIMFSLTILGKEGTKKSDWILLLLLLFSASGANETVAFLLVITFFVVSLLTLVPFGKKLIYQKKRLLYLGFVISLISAIIVYKAPGNGVRGEYFEKVRVGPYVSFTRALYSGPATVLELIKENSLVILSTVLVLSLYTYRSKKNSTLGIESVALTIVVLILYSVLYAFVGEYSLGRIQPGRSHIILSFFVVVAVILISKVLSSSLVKLDSRLKNNILVSVALFTLFISMNAYNKMYRSVVSAINYSQHFDKAMEKIYAEVSAGNLDVAIDPLPSSGFLHGASLKEDPNDWVNMCVEDYVELSLDLPEKPKIYTEN